MIVAATGAVWGAGAQRAAEAEMAGQGIPAAVLARHRINFAAGRASVLVAVSIGLFLTALAALNLAGSGTGQLLSWIVQPIVFVLGCLIIPSEVFLTQGIRSAFNKADDPALHSVDVDALVDAAVSTQPAWSRYVIAARFGLATVGSLLVVILLTVPAANTYFA
ncbi:hypothetical protein GCM10010349_68480 [Streptomyces flavofungini]|nr:hypothetical protein GCM10010349_68480 [Streptomyces flavofungini]